MKMKSVGLIKDGVEIFIGDILELHYPKKYFGNDNKIKVEVFEHNNKSYIKSIDDVDYLVPITNIGTYVINAKILGNIHENKELLNES